MDAKAVTAVMRIAKLKGPRKVLEAARHNRRDIQRENGATASIDPQRMCLNEALYGRATAKEVAQHADQLMRAAGVGKLRKDAVMALEILFSLPAGHDLDERAFFNDCWQWAAGEFGGAQNVLSADLHRDEAAPHCHVLLVPLVNGKMVGSALVGGRAKLRAIQASFHAAVAARYGLRKAPARLIGAAKLAGSKAVLKRLEQAADAALRSAVWPIIRECIEGDPTPFVAALDVEIDSPQKKLRTMAQVFTSKGKGKAFEPAL